MPECAALNYFERKGFNTAIGLDEAGINDDRDMLQQMRLVLRAHRVPGMTGDGADGRMPSKALLSYVRKFFADYIDPAKHEPFYRRKSRV